MTPTADTDRYTSLAAGGMARFLIGTSADSQEGYLVQARSVSGQMMLNAYRMVKGKRTRLAGPLPIDRTNQSTFDLKLDFTPQSMWRR